ncbi:MAG: tetratricopeptide repeat protein [Alphaproteobacteria bacterium]|nr:tetratricopeptide repeat protein [Alphaproteobacteria bacterium]
MISPMRISGRLASMLDLGRAMALAVMLVFAAVPADAAQDARLDPLFEKLKAAADAREAQIYENAIWRVWLEPDDGAINSLMRLGLDAQNRGDMFGAFAIYDAITGLKPDYAEGWNRRATVLFLLDRLEESRKDAEKTLELEPRHFGALSGLGLIAMRQNHPDKALEVLEKALAINPHMANVRGQVEQLRKKARDGAI